MNFKQVEAFRAVMATRSMTTAASLLSTSQPNISRRISLLEQYVGFVLFHRVGTRLVPTAEAEVFNLDVERVFLGFETLSETANSIRKRGTGVLRVGAVGSITASILPDAIGRFRKIYPDVPIILHTGRTDVVANWAATGFCDIGFCSYKIDIANVVFDLINTSQGVCIVHELHRLRHASLVTPSDLDGEKFISFEAQGINRKAIDKCFVPDRRVLSLETPYSPTICTLVAKGLGVSILNKLVVRANPHPNVVEIPFSKEIPFRTFAVSSEKVRVGVLSSAFRSCVSEVFDSFIDADR